MAERTEISWCDSTFNPWAGCTKVSPGCDNCYAEGWGKRSGRAVWGPGQPRRRTSRAYWEGPLKWNATPFYECLGCGHRFGFDKQGDVICQCGCDRVKEARRRVFCASLADVFDNEISPQWRCDLFDLIGRTSNLDWLLLTKRVGNAAKMLPWMPEGGANTWIASSAVWPNVWIGATIVNQEEADRDVPKLLAIPARVRFLSMEPLLGPVDLTRIPGPSTDFGKVTTSLNALAQVVTVKNTGAALFREAQHLADVGIDWVIVGGESGPKARPMHPEWVADLRDQCRDAGVPFLFKQWGEWKPLGQMPYSEKKAAQERFSHKDAHYVKLDGRTHTIARDDHERLDASDVLTLDVGKKASGRLLDGVEHNGYPPRMDEVPNA